MFLKVIYGFVIKQLGGIHFIFHLYRIRKNRLVLANQEIFIT